MLFQKQDKIFDVQQTNNTLALGKQQNTIGKSTNPGWFAWVQTAVAITIWSSHLTSQLPYSASVSLSAKWG